MPTNTKWELFLPATDAGLLNKSVTVEADNWMAALKAGLESLGQTTPAGHDLLVDIKGKVVHVTDVRSRRVFELRPVTDKGSDPGSSPSEAPGRPSATSGGRTRPKRTSASLQGSAQAAIAAALISHEVFFVRDEDPGPNNRLTYRERLIAVAPETSTEAAEALLRNIYQDLVTDIADKPRGKFINLAAFDHSFEKRADRPALAALDWKDWRGRDPVVSFPMQAPAVVETSHLPALALLQKPSQPAPPTPAPVKIAPSQPALPTPAPVKIAPSQPALPTPPPAKTAPSQPALPTPPPAKTAPSQPALPTPPPAKTAPSQPALPTPPPAKTAPSQPALPTPPPAKAAPSQPAPSPPTPSEPAPPRASAPAPTPEPEVDDGRHKRPSTPAEDLQIGRQSPPPPDLNEVIVEVFESMQELYTRKTRPEAITFAVELLAEKIPCEAIAAMAKPDDDADQMVCVATHGVKAEPLLHQPFALPGTLLGLAVQQEVAVAVSDVGSDPRVSAEVEHLVDGDTRSVLCVPFTFEGQTFGGAELINRAGGNTWHQGEIHIVSYVANHLAEYIAQSLPTSISFSDLDFEEASPSRTRRSSRPAMAPPAGKSAGKQAKRTSANGNSGGSKAKGSKSTKGSAGKKSGQSKGTSPRRRNS
jgi:hypothetical protein